MRLLEEAVEQHISLGRVEEKENPVSPRSQLPHVVHFFSFSHPHQLLRPNGSQYADQYNPRGYVLQMSVE